MGDGTAQCILCGDEFGLLGASPTFCDDCKKVRQRCLTCMGCGDEENSEKKVKN